MRREALGEKHPDVAQSLNNLGTFYSHQGQYGKAEPLCKQALEIYREALGEKHPDFAVSLKSLADLYHSQGQYGKAEPLCKQALEIYREALGEKHPDFAVSLNILAQLSASQGQYVKAEPLFKQALEIIRDTRGEKHPHFSGILHNLAMLYYSQRQYGKAEPHLKKALEITRETLGEKHPRFAVSLNNLAGLYYSQGQFGKAEPLLKQALEIEREALGEKHPNFAVSLNNLAVLYYWQGQYDKAEPLCKQALEIRREALGEKHPNFALSLNSLGGLQLGQKKHKLAATSCRQAVAIVAEHLETTAAVQTEQDQVSFASTHRPYLDNYLSAAAFADTTAQDAYAILLPWKGAVTRRQQMTRAARNILASSDQDVVALFQKLDDVTRQYANLVTRTIDPKAMTDLPKRLRVLDAERETLEVELARRTEAFRKIRQARQTTPADLQKALPADAVLVDFLVYQKRDPDKKTVERLVAFVITPKKIERLELGEMAPFTEAIDKYRLTLKRTRPITGKGDPAVFLRDKLWQPIAQHLGGAKTVLIAPDGAAVPTSFCRVAEHRREEVFDRGADDRGPSDSPVVARAARPAQGSAGRCVAEHVGIRRCRF